MSVRKPDPADLEVGERIRTQRRAVGLSQTELADELGVTYQQIQKYEKGLNRVGAGRLAKIATILRVPIIHLFDEKDRPDSADDTPSLLALLALPGALRLLQAYSRIQDRKLRRMIRQTIENITGHRR